MLICLFFRGKSVPQKTAPFRKWYGCLAELKSLLHSSVGFAAFTATATKATKNAIYQMLDLNVFKTLVIEKPPLRYNISYHFLYISKENTLENIFENLINDLKMKREKTERCIIFVKHASNALLFIPCFVCYWATTSSQNIHIVEARQMPLCICFMQVAHNQ